MTDALAQHAHTAHRPNTPFIRPHGQPHLQLLNGFTLTHHGTSIALPKAGQRVVAYVALRGRTQRDALAGRLWPESSEATARATLRNALWKISRAAPWLLTLVPPGFVALRPEVLVDVEQLQTSAWDLIDCEHQPSSDPAVPTMLGALRNAELLPGWYDEWLDDMREEVRQTRLHGLEALSRALLSEGRHAWALRCALEAAQMDPLRESAAAAVIRIHLAEHNVAAAARHYENFAHLLAAELGVAPTLQLRNLLQTGIEQLDGASR